MMRQIILLSLFFLSLQCFGQIRLPFPVKIQPVQISLNVKPDTVQVIILISDTAGGAYDDGSMFRFDSNVTPILRAEWIRRYVEHTVTWVYGYEVRGNKHEFLDAEKRPISKSIIVWQATETKDYPINK